MNNHPPSLNINTALARQILTEFLRDEVRRTGLKRAVLGLSGGLDSALVCQLAAEALGPENVLAVCLPYRTSNPDSLADAQLMIKHSGVISKERPHGRAGPGHQQ